ncbi:hypothetical protein OSH10_08530 [Kaistia defluvii]|uniref:hypothetical protein n=1 Tax=Kaistia defluvii TaxID=410841 RepID=UPI00224E8F87|nr:hypothetical protein [Kaistia defluvii]MCX5518480.1 hypothetical protein [Kaistia defluvii]
MGQRAATFTEVDLKRAIRAATKAGFEVKGVEITRLGTIRLLQTVTEEKIEVDDLEPVIL